MVDPGESAPWCDAALDVIRSLDHQGERRRGGVRGLLRSAAGLVPLLGESVAWQVAESILGSDCFVVRSVLFDKTPRANWKVAWHQDRSVAVRKRIDVAGFGPWSRKDGVVHVQPPPSVLEGMLTLRLHLDGCGEDNGPLRVISASHRAGLLDDRDAAAAVAEGDEKICLVGRGGLLAMRPLLLHASGSARSPEHRRVIHLEFAASALPGGLAWHDQTSAGGRDRPPGEGDDHG
ncbi:MAG: phytanoyl-CoA dioxygenase family protein [Phycisphaerae bacterium]|nr:phytanoyl-CoA dioxygenase family protein [Phycisphaerae bacterium]